jgi:hypothetical protein
MEQVIIGAMFTFLVVAIARAGRGRGRLPRRRWSASSSDFMPSDAGASSSPDPMMFTAADPVHSSMIDTSHCHTDTSSGFGHHSSCDTGSSSGFDSGGGGHHH